MKMATWASAHSPTDLLTVMKMATDTGGTTSMSILAAGGNADAILYFGTGRAMDRAKKAIIAIKGGTDDGRGVTPDVIYIFV